MKLVFTPWNAVTIVNWNQNTEQEKLVLSTVAEEPATKQSARSAAKYCGEKAAMVCGPIGGEQFRQRILTIVESCRKLGANPLE
jgi:DUF917 family protein